MDGCCSWKYHPYLLLADHRVQSGWSVPHRLQYHRKIESEKSAKNTCNLAITYKLSGLFGTIYYLAFAYWRLSKGNKLISDNLRNRRVCERLVKILGWMTLIFPALFILTDLGVFQIKYIDLMILTPVGCVCTLGPLAARKAGVPVRIMKYVSVICVAVVVMLLGGNSAIGIYMTYGLAMLFSLQRFLYKTEFVCYNERKRERGGVYMGERLTWEQIQERYPDQWVGLVEVKYMDDDGVSVESAVVKYMDKTKSELTRMVLRGEIISRHTNPDGHFQLGMVGVK